MQHSAKGDAGMDDGASKVVVVTGASRGLGEATAREIAARGHTVVATMRNPDDYTTFDAAEGTFDFERIDVTDPDNVKAGLGAVEARHGRIDVLINNAGYGLYGAVEDLGTDELTAQFDTNVLGTLRTCQAVLPGMRERGSGRILNVVTIVRSPMPWMGAYLASKAAVWHLSGSMAYEVAQFGVEVGVIEPSAYATEFQMDSLRMAERSRNGESPYGTQTQDSQVVVGELLANSPGPDEFGRHVAELVDVPDLPFWTIAANEEWQALVTSLAGMTLEEQGAVWRDAVPGLLP